MTIYAEKPKGNMLEAASLPISDDSEEGLAIKFYPKYQKIKKSLIHRVLKAEWRPGQMLPSEKKLAEEYGLSQGTVRRALLEMFAEGLVTRTAGCGTFVTSHQGAYTPTSFHSIYSNNGSRVAEDRCLYLHCASIKANQRVAKGLSIAPGALVSEIIRLRRSGSRTAVVENTYLSQDLCADAHDLIQRERPHSLYVVLERAYNLLIINVEERVRARLVTDAEAALLEVEQLTPVLEIERTAFSLGGHPVEWRTMVCDSTNFHYYRS
jgi:GntR family transcriptional regulator